METKMKTEKCIEKVKEKIDKMPPEHKAICAGLAGILFGIFIGTIINIVHRRRCK